MKQSKVLYTSSIVAALGGFLFGFDTVVISGAEQTIQKLWNLSETLHGLAISAALWGTVLGSLIGGWPTDHLGRKKTLISLGLLFFVSAVWSAFAQDVNSFMVARFIGGLGIGISTVASPLYISEIAPAKLRGRLAGMFQFNIVFGILMAFMSNALLKQIGENAWRWMLGVEAIPALIYTLSCFAIPESPRWLIGAQKNMDEGLKVLAKVNATASKAEIIQIAADIEAASQEDTHESGFWTMRHRVPILLAILIAFFNQLSGINAVLYFAPRIFEMTGLAAKAALLQSVGIGITNLIFTFLGLWLIDRLGRRTLLVIGSLGYIASLGLCSWAFYSGNVSIVPACIFAFIAAHAVGQGAVIWVFISEIFPNQHRASGQSLGSFTHWIFAALLTLFFPRMVTAFSPGSVFAFFCGMMCLQLLWVVTMVPETKGVPLEQIEEQLGIH
ncbi:sugar porter family MFS transporter [Bythopirellula polymerisocia]|uniref:D-xylose-proton symporter n=1 Tax=Bythopirellula polymerisocia TaxID=2528003 RepID=A0A5C6CJ11_9BACT|nr:sugar porter family MFS transporter [Bythopirellula polymerisocia]TWU24570.1 D-xylose-proton symporter [Bythopirellula polymerisocia]